MNFVMVKELLFVLLYAIINKNIKKPAPYLRIKKMPALSEKPTGMLVSRTVTGRLPLSKNPHKRQKSKRAAEAAPMETILKFPSLCR